MKFKAYSTYLDVELIAAINRHAEERERITGEPFPASRLIREILRNALKETGTKPDNL